MKKKILAIALTFVMAAAFCACGTEKTPASADGSADAAKGSGEEVTLYLSAAASMTESMDKAIAAYEKENPGVKIQATYDSSGTLKTQITSGADCDIFLSAAQKNACPTIADMVIDIGSTSKEETEKVYNIHIGAPVVPDVTFEYDESNDVMLGKAFDNRLGCAAVLDTMKDLKNEDLGVDVVGVLSSQEEIGERGAFVTRDVVKPDIAICFEGCPADDTFNPDYFIQTAMKKGPMLRHFDKSMVTNPRFQRFALELGRELGIPVQESVRSGGGTNGGPIHLSNGGVPVIIIGVPVRYIHSHHGFACMADYNNSVKLAVEIIKRLNDETIKSF